MKNLDFTNLRIREIKNPRYLKIKVKGYTFLSAGDTQMLAEKYGVSVPPCDSFLIPLIQSKYEFPFIEEITAEQFHAERKKGSDSDNQIKLV